jgi:hypothetical protein
MKKFFYCAAALSMILAGCAEKYDDTILKERVDTLEEQVQSNTNAIKALENALEDATKKGLTVTVTAIEGGNKLTFSDGTSINVMNGVDGQTGPVGPQGPAGQDAAKVSIKESADGNAYIITVGGKEYSIEKSVVFSLKLETVDVSLMPGETKEIAYTLTGGDAFTKVFVSACSGYSATIADGKVLITAPDTLPENGFVVISAVNNTTGEYTSQYVSFVKGNLTVTADAETVPAVGGLVTLTVTADCEYEVVIPEDCTWIQQVVPTKAMTTTYVTLNVAKNDSEDPRTATVAILSSAGNKQVVIAQEGAAADVMEAANSFIVSEAGTYKFQTVKGNSSESVGAVASCELLWETYNTEEYPLANCLIKSVSYSDGKVTFETVTPYREGNAGIAVKDASGKILWSWHIWLTDKPAEHVYHNEAGIFMDRNLGAYSATPGDVEALGFTYQWGRKDPFLSTAQATSPLQVGSTLTVSHNYNQYSDWPIVNYDEQIGTVEYSIAHPTTYIAYPEGSETYDWLYTSNDDLWNPETKTIYDPCPAGWRVASNEAYCKATGKESGYFEKTGTYDATAGGSNWTEDLGDYDVIWYPIMGYRGYDIGVHSQVNIDGPYWTSTPNTGTTESYRLYQDIYNGKGYITVGKAKGRSYGYPVRCMKE